MPSTTKQNTANTEYNPSPRQDNVPYQITKNIQDRLTERDKEDKSLTWTSVSQEPSPVELLWDVTEPWLELRLHPQDPKDPLPLQVPQETPRGPMSMARWELFWTSERDKNNVRQVILNVWILYKISGFPPLELAIRKKTGFRFITCT